MLSPTGTAQEQLNGQFHNPNNTQLTGNKVSGSPKLFGKSTQCILKSWVPPTVLVCVDDVLKPMKQCRFSFGCTCTPGVWILPLSLTVTHVHFPEQSCNGQRLLLISPPKYYLAKGNPFLVVPEMTWAVKWPQIAEWIACMSDCFLFFTVASALERLFLDLFNTSQMSPCMRQLKVEWWDITLVLTYSTHWNIH